MPPSDPDGICAPMTILTCHNAGKATLGGRNGARGNHLWFNVTVGIRKPFKTGAAGTDRDGYLA